MGTSKETSYQLPVPSTCSPVWIAAPLGFVDPSVRSLGAILKYGFSSINQPTLARARSVWLRRLVNVYSVVQPLV